MRLPGHSTFNLESVCCSEVRDTITSTKAAVLLQQYRYTYMITELLNEPVVSQILHNASHIELIFHEST